MVLTWATDISILMKALCLGHDGSASCKSQLFFGLLAKVFKYSPFPLYSYNNLSMGGGRGIRVWCTTTYINQ